MNDINTSAFLESPANRLDSYMQETATQNTPSTQSSTNLDHSQ